MNGVRPRIALLRAVNVGGRGNLVMAELRDFATGLGLADVRTLLQTGNLVFHGGDADSAALERRLEREALNRLGLASDVFVRSAEEWRELVARNPFREAAARDPARLVAMVLKRAPDKTALNALQKGIAGREKVAAVGRQLYAVYPDGIGRSKLTGGAIEKALGARGTARNWNTVLKIAALVGS